MSVIWITHDLGVIARMVNKVNVMYAGMIIEKGTVNEVFDNPKNPYTVGLLGSLPNPEDTSKKKLYSIPGEPPDLIGEIQGCPFAPRCTFVVDRCRQEMPPLEKINENHEVACWEKDKVEKV